MCKLKYLFKYKKDFFTIKHDFAELILQSQDQESISWWYKFSNIITWNTELKYFPNVKQIYQQLEERYKNEINK